MIIQVCQTKANFKQAFEIYYNDKLQYTGKQSGLSRHLPSLLCQLDGATRLESKRTTQGEMSYKLMNLLLVFGLFLLWKLFDSVALCILAMVVFSVLRAVLPFKSRTCKVFESYGEQVARFHHLNKGLLAAYDVIEAGNSEYRLYALNRSHYQYLSVYLNGEQIAQISKDLHTVNNRDNYTLYLLDEQAAAADLLTMFILYFDNFNHANPREVFVGTKKNWSWTYSRTDQFYDKTWLPSHFGWDAAADSGYSQQ